MRLRQILVIGAVTAALFGMAVGPSQARDVRAVLGNPGGGGGTDDVVGNALRPLGALIGAQVANQIPTLSTSAGYTYEYNSDLEVYERSAHTFGPLFAERAVTLGKGRFNFNVSYTYLDFQQINGHDLDNLSSRVERATLPTGEDGFAGLVNAESADQFTGLTDAQLFTEVIADLRIEAQIFDFSFTYGILDNLDINVDIPVVRTYSHISVNQQTLDPRFAALLDPDFAAMQPTVFDSARDREDALGIGDVRLRTKYLGLTGPVRLAGLMDFVMATGNKADFHGTGDWRLGTFLIASGTLLDIFEPHAQAGVEWNINDVDISQAKYGVGVTTQLTDFAAITIDFLGRSEFGRNGRIPASGRLPAVGDDGAFLADEDGNLFETDEHGRNRPIFPGRPLFADIKRNDILDLALGAKLALTEQAIVFATFIIPLNQDGLRADFVPTVGFEASF